MSLYTSHFAPSSPFHTSHAFDDRLGNLRRNPFVSKSPSIAYHRSSHFTDDIINRLDRIATLGGEDINGNTVGHSGCVNALAWSPSGHCLATGSDDRRIILWKLGSSDKHPQSYNSERLPDKRGYPKLDLAQADVIETGHRANIFNVKWAPNCSDQRLFTCAGDNQVRVFDLSRASSAVDRRLKGGKEYRLWEEGQGACTRVLRCHSGRAKKISTENSPDIFLTAAEDGEVRQTDLRVPHTCSRSQSYGQGCPRPLMQFKMELYSISVSKLEPWLFAISGTSDKVYLQDRRMIPRLLKNEWGSYIDQETAALTHCVRRFCREPKVKAGEQDTASKRYERHHVTAIKISEANGRDLLASYSGDGVYRFDIKANTGIQKRTEPSMLHTSKRRKTSSGSVTPQPDSILSPETSPPLDAFLPEDFSGSVTPEPEELFSPEIIATRRRVVLSLFQPESEADLIADTLSKDLDLLEEAIPEDWPDSQADQLLEEEGTVALCRLLHYVKRTTAERSETVDLDLESYKRALLGSLTRSGDYELMPLIEELQVANRIKDYSEEVKVKLILWDRAEEYIRRQWEIEETESDVDMQQGEVASTILTGNFHDRLQALIEADFNSDDSDQDARILEELDELNRLAPGFSEDDDLSDEDDDEGDDEESTARFSESADEEGADRHGISGGNAPFVYENGCFLGHANNETVKDCGFLGSNDEYVWSGSDDGHYFIWTNDHRGQLMGIWKGDGSVVNALTQHPVLPIFAVSGIDDDIKIFGPVSHGSKRITDVMDRRDEIIRRNSLQERIGFNPQRIRHMFARQMGLVQGGGTGEGVEEEDCTVM